MLESIFDNHSTQHKEYIMHYAGIDLRRRTIVKAIEDENGPIGKAKSFDCRD